MSRRLRLAVLTALGGVSVLPATVLAQRSPSFVTPTTTTTTTTAPVLVTPTTTTTTTTTTTQPVIAAATTTTAPVLVAPSTTTTTTPVFVSPTTTIALDDLAQATVEPDGDGSDVPIGVIDTGGTIPEGLDISAFPGAPTAPTPAADGPTFTAGLTCAYQCIKSGVAYPRGIGALLVVETYVPAELLMTVIDADDNLVDYVYSDGMVTEFSWALDHLEPGQTYYAMVAATDENGDEALAFGSFVTLSERTVHVTIGDVTVNGGPQNVVRTDVYLRVDGFGYWSVETGSDVGSVYANRGRHLDLALLTFRTWATSETTFCEGLDPDDVQPQGDLDSSCGSWNTASLGNVDLDVIPAGQSHWTSVTVSTTINTPAGDDVLPDSHGDPRFFHFNAPVTLEVSYS